MDFKYKSGDKKAGKIDNNNRFLFSWAKFVTPLLIYKLRCNEPVTAMLERKKFCLLHFSHLSDSGNSHAWQYNNARKRPQFVAEGKL